MFLRMGQSGRAVYGAYLRHLRCDPRHRRDAREVPNKDCWLHH